MAGVELRPDLGPRFPSRASQRPRMLVAENRAVPLVVDQDEVRSPAQRHREGRRQDQIDRQGQAFRPPRARSQGRMRPILRPHRIGHAAVGDSPAGRDGEGGFCHGVPEFETGSLTIDARPRQLRGRDVADVTGRARRIDVVRSDHAAFEEIRDGGEDVPVAGHPADVHLRERYGTGAGSGGEAKGQNEGRAPAHQGAGVRRSRPASRTSTHPVIDIATRSS